MYISSFIVFLPNFRIFRTLDLPYLTTSPMVFSPVRFIQLCNRTDISNVSKEIGTSNGSVYFSASRGLLKTSGQTAYRGNTSIPFASLRTSKMSAFLGIVHILSVYFISPQPSSAATARLDAEEVLPFRSKIPYRSIPNSCAGCCEFLPYSNRLIDCFLTCS